MSSSLAVTAANAHLNCRENDITDILDLTFSTEDNRFGETVTIDLKPGGQEIEVTNENKTEYVEYVTYLGLRGSVLC